MPTEEAAPVSQPETDETQVSVADYRNDRLKPESTNQETTAQPSTEKEKASKTAPASEPEKPEIKGKQEAGEGDEKPSSYRKLQRRLDGFSRENSELRRELDELKKPKEIPKPIAQGDDPKPTPDKFKTYEEYVEATADWKARQLLKARDEKATKDEQAETEKERKEAWDAKVTAYRSTADELADKYEDFQAALSDPEAVLPMYVQNAILGMGAKGPEVAYQLAKNKEVRAKIVEYFNQGEHQEAWIEFGVFVRSLSSQKSPEIPAKPQTKAPTPITPVGGAGGTQEVDLEKDMPVAEYRRLRAAGRV